MKIFDKIKEAQIEDYIVSFNYNTCKISVRRKDGKKIDQKSEKFKNDINRIKQSKEYIANMNMMRVSSVKYKEDVAQKESDKLLEFTKYLLNQDK